MPNETIYGITGILVVLAILVWMRLKKKANIENVAVNIIITSGICCTFIGISYGLYSFDVENMEDNLKVLISGIKTAFIPSAVAVSIALLWKLIETFIKTFKSQSGAEVSGATIDDLVAKQMEQIDHFKTTFNQKDSLFYEHLDSIRKEIVMGFRDMGESFNRFAEKVADANSQALIDALNEVIKDFNAKINEQFGENFKHLNEAVGRLLDWQDRYAVELDKKISFFENLQEQLAQHIENYDQIVKNSEAFENSASNLSKIIETSNQQQNALAGNLEKLSELCDALGRDIPIVIDRTEEISQTSQEFLEQIKENGESLIQGLRQFDEESKRVMQEGIENASKISQGLLRQIKENDEKVMQSLHDFHAKATDAMSKGIAEVSGEIKNQVQAVHHGLESALNDSLNGLGSQLASLSNKFVSDYTPLTDELRRVVEIAKGVR